MLPLLAVAVARPPGPVDAPVPARPASRAVVGRICARGERDCLEKEISRPRWSWCCATWRKSSAQTAAAVDGPGSAVSVGPDHPDPLTGRRARRSACS
eukprot:3390409-Pleurochrysis_carterae.AAC.1